MFNLNKVILIGNLGADPEIKHFEGDKMLANVRIATTESYRDKNNIKHEVTEWHDVELWDNLAKVVAQYVRKGDTIYIEGKIKSDTWTDEQGNNRKKIKIRATQ
ncbi:MAG: single-stranded DNA-binding protein, partial [Flammeovirgaceae bacterium]|nr:single-stranded DNA-binding protein [Flammeovirgaceae bacterium]